MLVQASGLVKQYPRVRALDQVSLEIKEGEVFGLFGPNGAGKTTCLRVLSGLTQPDAGSATVCGIDVRAAPNEVRRELGILIDIPFPYEEVTVRRYLSFFAEMAGVPAYDIPMKVEWALTLLGITHHRESRIGKLSMGERQRTELARVMLGNARMLFLDEPFSNVDVSMRIGLRSILRDWVSRGGSILFTSHNLLESEAIVDQGRRLPLWMWLATFLVAVLGFLFFLGPALTSARYYSQFSWRWYDSSLRLYYAISAGLTSLILSLTFARVHYGEVHRGTIRSIILYPVDMNDIAIAKLLSSLIVAAALSTMLFFGIFGAFFLVGEWPIADFLVIHVTALAMSFLALAVGVFLAQAIAHVAGRMVVSPTALGAISLLLSVLFTETGLTAIGTQVAYLLRPSAGGLTQPAYEAIVAVAKALSVLSPHHVGARVVGIAFGLTNFWVDFHVVVPLALLVFAGGYLLGKKLYLDIFIR